MEIGTDIFFWNVICKTTRIKSKIYKYIFREDKVDLKINNYGYYSVYITDAINMILSVNLFFLQVENFAIDKSIILTWRSPWTEEPSGLQSIGSQSVRHNWSYIPHTHTHTHTHTIYVLWIYWIKLKINNINISGKAPQIWKSFLSLPFFICVKEGINRKINILNWINIRK